MREREIDEGVCARFCVCACVCVRATHCAAAWRRIVQKSIAAKRQSIPATPPEDVSHSIGQLVGLADRVGFDAVGFAENGFSVLSKFRLSPSHAAKLRSAAATFVRRREERMKFHCGLTGSWTFKYLRTNTVCTSAPMHVAMALG